MAGVMLTDLKYPHSQKRLADYLKGHDKQKVSLKQVENLLVLEQQHDFHSDILSDFFNGKGSPVSKAPEQLPVDAVHGVHSNGLLGSETIKAFMVLEIPPPIPSFIQYLSRYLNRLCTPKFDIVSVLFPKISDKLNVTVG